MALLPAALEQHARGVRLLPPLQAQLAHARRCIHVVLRALVRVGVMQGSRSGRGGGSGQGGLVGAAIRVRAERPLGTGSGLEGLGSGSGLKGLGSG